MALTKEEKQELELLKKAVKFTPNVARGVIRSKSFPKEIPSAAASEIKGVLETVGNKVSGTGFLAGFVNKGAGEAIQNITGSNAATDKAVKISNIILNNAKVGEQSLSAKYEVVGVGNTYYLKDKQTSDYYLFNRVMGNKPIEALTINLAELVGAVGGGIAGGVAAGATGIATGGLGAATIPAAITVGSSGGGSIGAGLAQGLREGIEGKYGESGLGSGTANVAGEMGRAAIEDSVIGGGIKTIGQVAKVGILGAGNLLKLIPHSTVLAKHLDDITKSAKVKTSTITKPLQDVGNRIKITSKQVSDSVANSQWVRQIGKNPAITGFNDYVSGLESTNFGSLILGVDKKIIDETLTMDELLQVNTKLRGTENLISAFTKKVNALRGILPAQKEAAVAARKTAEGAGNIFFDKFTDLSQQKMARALDAYNHFVKAEFTKNNLQTPNAVRNITNAQEAINRQFDIAANDLDTQITLLKQQAKAAGVDLGDDLIEKDIVNAQTKFNQDSSLITSEAQRRLDVMKTSKKTVEEIQQAHQQELLKTQTNIDKALNVNPQEVGRELRNKLQQKWDKQLLEEKKMYEGAIKLAPQEANIELDISDFIANTYDRLGEVFTENQMGQLSGKIPGQIANPKQILDFKQNLDTLLSGGIRNSDLSGAQYSTLAKIRDDLVTADNSVFKQFAPKSNAIKQYTIASDARITRNDFLQAGEYAALVGARSDSKTGKIVRNANYAKDTYDNFIDIAGRDKDVANRTLSYIGGEDLTPEVEKLATDLKKGYVNSIWRGTGRDAAGTLDQLDPNVIKELGNGLGKGELDNIFTEMGDVSNLQSVKLPTRPDDIGGYAETMADIKQTSALNKAAKARDNAVYNLEKKKQQQALRRETFDIGSKVTQLEKSKKVLDTARKFDDVTFAVAESNRLPSILMNSERGLPASVAAKELKETNPQELEKILGDLNFTQEQQLNFYKNIDELPEAIKTVERTQAAIDAGEKRLDDLLVKRSGELNSAMAQRSVVGAVGGGAIAGESGGKDFDWERAGKGALGGFAFSRLAIPAIQSASSRIGKALPEIGAATRAIRVAPATSFINEAGQAAGRLAGAGVGPNARQSDIEQQLLEGASFANDPNQIPNLTPEERIRLKGRASINLSDLLGAF